MADYRLSAQVISRGKGQSSIASAAYRAAARLDDPRTGEIHDYTRKQGVVYSAVLAPENAPEWMRDRGQLWQAVEAAEKRRDAQLARELQLSLPHELDQAQRKALLLGFVREQFVAHGMIADVAIHAPGREGDERNHHAHVMLTMRSLTGEGFGNKVRDWNDPATLLQWREQWAHHQNRALERHGHAARVDHRSYEDRGIDREPSQHLGPTAADMERKGKPSRIGDENRERDEENSNRADRYRQHLTLEERRDRARQQFETWAHDKVARITRSMEARHTLDKNDLSERHDRQTHRLADELRQQYGTHKATIGGEVAAIDRRLQAKGLRKFVRGIFGRTRADEKSRQDLARSLRSIEQREQEARRALEKRQQADRDGLREKIDRQKERRVAGIERVRERRQDAGWVGKSQSTPERFDRSVPEQARTAETKPAREAFDQVREKAPPDREASLRTQEVEQRPEWWEKDNNAPDQLGREWVEQAMKRADDQPPEKTWIDRLNDSASPMGLRSGLSSEPEAGRDQDHEHGRERLPSREPRIDKD